MFVIDILRNVIEQQIKVCKNVFNYIYVIHLFEQVFVEDKILTYTVLTFPVILKISLILKYV